jgi:hypothetical protein
MSFLSNRGFKNLSGVSYDRDFTFYTEHQEYKVSRVVAVFFSQAVANMIKADAQANRFKISDPNNLFSNIYNMMNGAALKITPDTIDSLYDFAIKLQNEELAQLIDTARANDTLTTYTIVNRIARRASLGLQLVKEFNFVCEKRRLIPASNIAELGIQIVKEFFEMSELASIMDYVYEIVIACIDKYGAQKTAPLFSYINFQNLGNDQIAAFMDHVSADIISPEVWYSITSRLIQKQKEVPKYVLKKIDQDEEEKEYNPVSEVDPDNLDSYTPPVISEEGVVVVVEVEPDQSDNSRDNWAPDLDPITPPGGDAFGGIFNYYNARNATMTNDIIITASSGSYATMRLTNPSNTDYYLSSDAPFTPNTPSISVNFRNAKLRMTAYTFRTLNYDAGNYHIKSWVVEGSNDSSYWVLLDKHTNCQVMNSRSKIATFAVKRAEPFKYIRIRMTGENFWRTRQLCLSSFELFGNLIPN